MGCAQCKIENGEAVSRCKDRKRFMKEVVSRRHAFAAAHNSYAMCLKNFGHALSDYTMAEFPHRPSSSAVAGASPSTEIPPRRGSLPNFQNPVPSQRAPSTPEIKPKPVGPTMTEYEELGQAPQQPPPRKEEAMRGSTTHQGISRSNCIFAPLETVRGSSLSEAEVVEKLSRREFVEKTSGVPMGKDPEPASNAELPVQAPILKGTGKVGRERGRRSAKPSSFMQLFADLDDHFLKAFESAREVSNILEVSRLHYDSNFADNRAHMDHLKRVMGAITWNHSFEGLPSVNDSKDDFNTEENESHASVLDKLLAWEKKLYDEVKAAEIMEYEYQKKVAFLNEQKQRCSNPESLEKLEVAVHHLHTRYTVDMQSMDLTIAEINRLRDEQLYPKLVQLVDGMATMWETMRYHHETQTYIIFALKSLHNHEVVRETSESLCGLTILLFHVVSDWQELFCRLIEFQKEYIRALSNWVKLSLIPIESNLKEQVSPPLRDQNPPILDLLIDWDDDLDKLPDEVARSAISIFAAAIQTVVSDQEEEINLREACESKEKKLQRVGEQYQEWCMKNGVIGELDADNPLKIAKEERESVVISLRQKLEKDMDECQKVSRQVREKSLASLKHRLPELFRAMSEIALACSVMYSSLRSIAENQFPAQNHERK